MRIINSLKEININEEDFPIFFWDKWLLYETSDQSNVFLYLDENFNAVVPFKIHQLKWLKKADYIYKPLKLDGNDLNTDDEKNMIDDFHCYLKKNRMCDVIMPPQHICNFKSVPSKVNYYELGIISIDLSKDENTIIKDMSSNYRNEIKKAINSELIFSFDNFNLMDFYLLYSDTHRRQELECLSKNHYIKFQDLFPDNMKIGLAKSIDVSESAIFIYYDHRNAYYDSAGNSKNMTYAGANKALLYQAILDVKKIGIKKFILGGYRNPKMTDAKHNGIQNFKLRFGSQIEVGYHFIKIINPLKYHLFMLALKIKSIITGKELGFINKSGLEIKKSK